MKLAESIFVELLVEVMENARDVQDMSKTLGTVLHVCLQTSLIAKCDYGIAACLTPPRGTSNPASTTAACLVECVHRESLSDRWWLAVHLCCG